VPDHVTREIELPVDPAEAWTWLTDPDALGRWFGADVELDPRPAGRGCFRFPDGETRFALVETVDPGHELAFRWWPARDHDDASRVAIELEQTDDGSTVRVTETRLRAATVGPRAALACA
jgi:uncharacterized protein YndB with AHSA1/START domain